MRYNYMLMQLSELRIWSGQNLYKSKHKGHIFFICFYRTTIRKLIKP